MRVRFQTSAIERVLMKREDEPAGAVGVAGAEPHRGSGVGPAAHDVGESDGWKVPRSSASPGRTTEELF